LVPIASISPSSNADIAATQRGIRRWRVAWMSLRARGSASLRAHVRYEGVCAMCKFIEWDGDGTPTRS
jgi:hypothetical protein